MVQPKIFSVTSSSRQMGSLRGEESLSCPMQSRYCNVWFFVIMEVSFFSSPCPTPALLGQPSYIVSWNIILGTDSWNFFEKEFGITYLPPRSSLVCWECNHFDANSNIWRVKPFSVLQCLHRPVYTVGKYGSLHLSQCSCQEAPTKACSSIWISANHWEMRHIPPWEIPRSPCSREQPMPLTQEVLEAKVCPCSPAWI